MFEKEIKFIYDFSINEVRQLGSFFTFEELSAVDLHPAIIKYISAELDYLIYEDRQRLLNNSNFDYSGDQIMKYFGLIGEEIKKTKKLSFDYVDNLILHAISFNVNFLARPRWALTKLIFAKENQVNTAELRQIISYIYFNDYIKTIIEKYLLKKKLFSISREEFETVLEKIDHEVFSSDPARLVGLVLQSIGEFFNIGSLLKSKIPLTPFEMFLKEKKLDNYLERLEKSFGGEPKQHYDIIELKNIIFSRGVQPEARKKETFREKEIPSQKETAPEKEDEQKNENYLDRILKQEKPASLFSFVKPVPENPVQKPQSQENETPAQTKDTASGDIAPNNTDSKDTDSKDADSKEGFDTLLNDEISREIKSDAENTYSIADVPEPDSLEPDETGILKDETPEFEDHGNDSAEEDDTVILEIPEAEEPYEELKFEEIEESDKGGENIPEEEPEAEIMPEAEEETDDDIHFEITEDNEEEDIAPPAEKKPGFISRLFRGGRSKEIENYEMHKEPEETSASFEIDKTSEVEETLPAEEAAPVSGSQEEVSEEVSDEISEEGFRFDPGEDSDEIAETEELKDLEMKLEENGFQGVGGTFSRISSAIAEIFSKREQRKIISTLFDENEEKFAGVIYNIITEAHDAAEAEKLIDSALKANSIDLSDKWAKVFKKNILKYFNQD